MTNSEYERIVGIAVDEATNLTNTLRPDRNDDSGWDKFHDQHFDNVLTYIDEHTDLGHIEAAEISEVCSEVESDIRHSDILGL
jgi:hypothetical protein